MCAHVYVSLQPKLLFFTGSLLVLAIDCPHFKAHFDLTNVPECLTDASLSDHEIPDVHIADGLVWCPELRASRVLYFYWYVATGLLSSWASLGSNARQFYYLRPVLIQGRVASFTGFGQFWQSWGLQSCYFPL